MSIEFHIGTSPREHFCVEFADILTAGYAKQRVSEGKAEAPVRGFSRDEFQVCLAEAGSQRVLPIFLTTAATVHR